MRDGSFQPLESLRIPVVVYLRGRQGLREEERERFRQFLSTKGYREVEEMEVTWADKMMEKGREQGLKSGVIEGKRETLLRQLTAKFGSVSEETKSRVQTLESVVELDAYLERVLTAKSIEDMGL